MATSTEQVRRLVAARIEAGNNEPRSLPQERYSCLLPTSRNPTYGLIDVEYLPDRFAIDDESFFNYVTSFREVAVSCEGLASAIADDLMMALEPLELTVTVHQNPRGGIEVQVVSRRHRESDGR